MRVVLTLFLLTALSSCGDFALVEQPVVPTPPTPVPAETVSVQGVWNTCRGSLSFDEGAGTWELSQVANSCIVGGVYSTDGNLLSRVVERNDCEGGGEVGAIIQDRYSVAQNALTLVSDTEAVGSETLYADEGGYTQLWSLVGTQDDDPSGTELRTIVSVAGYGERRSVCYWSEDGDCGGLISCSGRIQTWEVSTAAATAQLFCSGWCPCAAVLSGFAEPSGLLVGRYYASSCERNFTGPFSLTRL